MSWFIPLKCSDGFHQFEPRYSEKPAGFTPSKASGDMSKIRSLMFYNVYEKDICVKCGEVK
jgi:hypothetical protein